MQITIETLVNASLDKVWTAWITPDDINQWNTALETWHTLNSRNDLRVGGTFSFRMEAKDGSMGFDFGGTYTEVIPQQRIEYVLGDNRGVSVTFEAVEEGIRVVERFETEDVNAAEMQRQGWQAILTNFARYVEAKGTSA